MWARLVRDRYLLTVAIVSIVARALISMMQITNVAWWPSWLPEPSMWADFTIYQSQLHYITQGFIPYRDFGYNYGPLFIYTMLPFYLISSKLAFLPIVISDALTVPLLYAITERIAGVRVALIVALGYALSPYVLVNEGYLWLSNQPMTLLLLLMVYFIQSERPLSATLCLTVAVLFKQEALFALPPYLVAYARQYGRQIVKGAILAVSVLLVTVAPFIIMAPNAFSYSMMYGPFINLGPVEPSGMPTDLLTAVSQATYSSANCSLTTLAGIFTGTICGRIFEPQLFAQHLTIAKVDRVAIFLTPALLSVFAFGLLAIRRAPNLLQVACVYSFIGGLLVFSQFVHPVFAYYLVPVYALLLTSATDMRTATVALIASAAVAFVPEGPFQILLPLVSVFAIVSLEASRQIRGDGRL